MSFSRSISVMRMTRGANAASRVPRQEDDIVMTVLRTALNQ